MRGQTEELAETASSPGPAIVGQADDSHQQHLTNGHLQGQNSCSAMVLRDENHPLTTHRGPAGLPPGSSCNCEATKKPPPGRGLGSKAVVERDYASIPPLTLTPVILPPMR